MNKQFLIGLGLVGALAVTGATIKHFTPPAPRQRRNSKSRS